MKLFTLLIISIAISTGAISQSKDSIHWSPVKLKATDFRAKPDRSLPFAAITTSSILFNYSYHDTSFRFNVNCVFHKDKSWNKYPADSIILNHEQGHFDITEIYARRLKQALQTYGLNERTVKSDVAEIANKVLAEKNIVQKRYDEETDFSRDRSGQKYWDDKIAKELDSNSNLR